MDTHVPLFDTKNKRLLLFLLSIVLHYVPLILPREFCLFEFKRMLVFFVLGVVSFEQEKIRNAVAGFAYWRMTVAVMLFSGLQYVNLTIGNRGGNAASMLLPYVGIWAIVEVSKLLCNKCRIGVDSKLLLLSSSSYIIYLFHTTFEGFAKAIFLKIPFDIDLWYVFVSEVIIVVSCGVIMPMLLYKIFKKHRSTRVLFGL